jgi:predicted GNAT superfamily acetyltransferase
MAYGALVPDDPAVSPEVLSGAAEAVARAEKRSGVVVREASGLADERVARKVFDEIWPSISGGSQIQPNLLRALIHAGGYVSVAYAGALPVGAAFAAVGRHRDHAGCWQQHLHSHMAGVTQDSRNRGIGTAMKLHQRLWGLERGIGSIRWTFDPLVRRNARLNLHRLGARVIAYEVDFYGAMDDAVNANDPTDRLVVDWALASELVAAAAREPLPAVRPQPGAVLVELPEDIVALRSRDREAAAGWRMTVRSSMLAAMNRGMHVAGLDAGGSYVLIGGDDER